MGVDGAPEVDELERVPKVPPEPRVFVLIAPGGSESGRLGMWGSGLL